MLSPLIRRPPSSLEPRSKERGVTMALVAVSLVAIIAMAALSIDIGTLYEAKTEAQRAADAAALTAARVISISGITTDPTNASSSWQPTCGGTTSAATLSAVQIVQNTQMQNLIGGAAASKVNVCYGTGACTSTSTNTDCTTAGGNFGINPVVSVYVQQATLPTFFARVFSLLPSGKSSNSGVSATATAEVFNPSGSSPMIPVNPRCVKPWFVPNEDPDHATPPNNSFVGETTGQITNSGTLASNNGVIGETFSLSPDCGFSGRRRGLPCTPTDNPPVANAANNTLDYLPGEVSNSSIAIAANAAIGGCSEATFNEYSEAVAGCDQTTYACGNDQASAVDLSEDPGPPRNDSVNAAQCLTNASASGLGNGQDYLATVAGANPGPPPYSYPFQILAGANSALVSAGLASGSQITNSPSVVSLPIYDSNAIKIFKAGAINQVTVIGFLQVFINNADSAGGTDGKINVTVMNVAGCGDSSGASPVVLGTSPVPIRLITPP